MHDIDALVREQLSEGRVGGHAPAGGKRLRDRRIGIADPDEFDAIRILNPARVELGDEAGSDDCGADGCSRHNSRCVQALAPWLPCAPAWRSFDALRSRTSWKKSTYFPATTSQL